MAPPITPSSRHSLTQNGSLSDSRQTKDPNIARTPDNVGQLQPRTARSSPHVPVQSTSIRKSSQFASAPRFSSSVRKQPSQTSTSSSPSLRRDLIEDSNELSPGRVSISSNSALLNRIGSGNGREQIEEFSVENEGNVSDTLERHDSDQATDDILPAAKRRKTPFPPSWHDHTKPIDVSSTTKGAFDDLQAVRTVGVTTPERLKRRPPIMISSSPASRDEDRSLTSPMRFSPVSPSTSNTKRKAPRFNFGGTRESMDRILDASNGLQRVIANPQFVLPPVPADDNIHDATSLANTNLALLFSPQKHKKYQYAPGGLAATVRDWVIHSAVRASDDSVGSAFRILSIKPGQRASQLVFGVDTSGEEQNYILFGNALGSSEVQLQVGDNVVVLEPSWCVELENEIWRVGIKWKTNANDNM